MIMTIQHFLNHVKQIIGRTFHIILFFDMITTYTQLYLVFLVALLILFTENFYGLTI